MFSYDFPLATKYLENVGKNTVGCSGSSSRIAMIFIIAAGCKRLSNTTVPFVATSGSTMT
jgi:hypothetical protein